MARIRNPWLGIGLDIWSLGFEASAVICLRTLKVSAGGVAGRSEASRMLREKVDAGLTLHSLALTGALGMTPHGAAARTLTHLRRKVRANRRRLSKS